jgi:hypothetical protein
MKSNQGKHSSSSSAAKKQHRILEKCSPSLSYSMNSTIKQILEVSSLPDKCFQVENTHIQVGLWKI